MRMNKPDQTLAEDLKLREIPAEEFIIQRDKLPPSLRAFLDPHTKEKYEEMKAALFLSEDNNSGFGLRPDGGLISVFSLEKEKGPKLVQEALSRGAKYLSCCGEKLKELYEEAGFVITKHKEDR